jgi:hypothetical protein
LDVDGPVDASRAVIQALVTTETKTRVEPVYFDREEKRWRYARRATTQMLNVPLSLYDDPVSFAEGSSIVLLDRPGNDGALALVEARLQNSARILIADESKSTASGEDHPLAPILERRGMTLRPWQFNGSAGKAPRE